MSKPAPNNISFQVTISKAAYEDVNDIVAAINEVRKGKEPPITRSQFIETLIQAFIYSHIVNDKENKDERKEEN